MSVRPGTRLDGRYRLADRLAYGGMGEVWQATDEVLSRSVAVKILRPELAEDEAFVRRFRAEARTTSGLPHNGIAAVYDYGETRVGANGSSPAPLEETGADPVAYLVMELVPGEALSSTLSRDGALGSDRTMDLVAQAARALHAAHQRGVIHRDIKPANLMVTPDGRVKVTDFGIARPLDHEPLTATGQVMGTAHYLAPELAKGYDASPLSDVYALGVVAYECLAGHRPFEGDNQVAVALAHLNEQPPPLPGTISEELRAVVGAAMEKDPSRRMPSAEAFAAALETLRYRSGSGGDETLTPGTGILPGSPAAQGLSAAGLYVPDQGGYQPGGRGSPIGAGSAPPPTPATMLGGGVQLLRPEGAASAAGMRTGSFSPAQGALNGTGGTNGTGQLMGYGGYGTGPTDPFGRHTSPGGISITPGDPDGDESGGRKINVPLLALIGLAVVVAVIVVVSQMVRTSGTGTTINETTPSPSTPAHSAPSSSVSVPPPLLTPSRPVSTSVSRRPTTSHSTRPSTTRSITTSTSPTTSPSSSTATTSSSTTSSSTTSSATTTKSGSTASGSASASPVTPSSAGVTGGAPAGAKIGVGGLLGGGGAAP